ncbi:unnamed protein product, partial [Amoebophrya sp. A25]
KLEETTVEERCNATDGPTGLECDLCDFSIPQEALLWSCTRRYQEKTLLHATCYDICESCFEFYTSPEYRSLVEAGVILSRPIKKDMRDFQQDVLEKKQIIEEFQKRFRKETPNYHGKAMHEAHVRALLSKVEEKIKKVDDLRKAAP